jgi:hypothetical protein
MHISFWINTCTSHKKPFSLNLFFYAATIVAANTSRKIGGSSKPIKSVAIRTAKAEIAKEHTSIRRVAPQMQLV